MSANTWLGQIRVHEKKSFIDKNLKIRVEDLQNLFKKETLASYYLGGWGDFWTVLVTKERMTETRFDLVWFSIFY